MKNHYVLGPSEAQTLIQLMMTSIEGQGDIEIVRVSCLQSIINSFSPLLFDVLPSFGLQELLWACEQCQDVDESSSEKWVNI